ncbi:MAG: PAC2 family protein [Bifidobacteriaceae bacterium]|nr:PAC2 family protein [Bifidobacteriaceae bacterium]
MPANEPVTLPGPIVLAAFAGWNDAGGAATSAIALAAEQLNAQTFALIDPEGYCDFQVNRPQLRFDPQGQRHLVWPSTDFLRATTPAGQDLVLVLGVEPSFHWQDYCEEVAEVLAGEGAASLVTIGALLADVPHSRAIPVQATSDVPALRERFGLEKSAYQGPVGINTVLERFLADQLDIQGVSLWAAVPHYVANPPSPKAQAALLTKIEELIGYHFDLKELNEEARAWQEGVDALAAEDEDIAEYVAGLEATKDVLDSPAASGEALAKEFERYLQRRTDQ